MKTNAIIRIILFSIVILVLLCILGIGTAAGLFMTDIDSMFSDSKGTVSSSGTADAGAVEKLSIDWAAGNITIRSADVSDLTFTEYQATEDSTMVWLQSGDTLKISYREKALKLHYGNITGKDLLIEVPRDWNCRELEVDAAATDLTVEDLTIKSVEFDGASGNFEFHGCTVDAIDIDTASGDIYFDGSLNTLECDAASADCEIILTNCPSRIDMDMASGDLDLTLPEDCGFTATLEALSGHLDTDFQVSHSKNGFTSGDGACRIDVSAMSGDIYIHKLTEAWNCDH